MTLNKYQTRLSRSAKSQRISESLNSSTASGQLLTSTQQAMIADNLLWLAYLLPAGLLLRLFLSDRYSEYRESVLKEQIKTLEKLWQHSTEP